MSFFLFFAIWLLMLALTHWYVGYRMITHAKLSKRARLAAWATVAGIFLLPQIPFFLLVNRREGVWTDGLSWIGYVALGFFSLALSGTVLRDALLLVKGVIGRAIAVVVGGRASNVDKQRRNFLIHSSNLAVLGLSAAGAGYGFYEARRRADIENVRVPIAALPPEFDGFRILQFTDIHVGPTIKRRYVEGVVEQIGSLNADLIAFTGDLVDGSVPWLKDDVAPLRELRAPHGVYFVTGNHEYYSGEGPWITEAGRLGFDVLINEYRIIEWGDARLVLAGVTDYSAGDFNQDHISDPVRAVAGAPLDVPRILLAHQPRSIEAAQHAGYVLQLSGHTHGGQFFPWNHLATLNQPYIKGLHKRGDTWVYVSRGTGYWGPPLRIGIPPELSVITLVRA